MATRVGSYGGGHGFGGASRGSLIVARVLMEVAGEYMELSRRLGRRAPGSPRGATAEIAGEVLELAAQEILTRGCIRSKTLSWLKDVEAHLRHSMLPTTKFSRAVRLARTAECWGLYLGDYPPPHVDDMSLELVPLGP